MILNYENALIDRAAVLSVYADALRDIEAALYHGSLRMSGWIGGPKESRDGEMQRLQSAAKRIMGSASALVLVGVGGSYLGTRALDAMLSSGRHGVRLYYAGWNLSGAYHRQLLSRLEKETDIAVCVISKSGGTLEPAQAFSLLKAYLQRRYGNDWQSRVYVVTDARNGALRRETERMGYCAFAVPEDIGGRYSVLTAVGFLPLAAAGVDAEALAAGARAAASALRAEKIGENPCYAYAASCLWCQRQLGKSVEVFSVTEPSLHGLTLWLKQLFGESEGKQGKGIYPDTLLYSSDLHSMGQFLEGGRPISFESLISVAEKTEAVGDTASDAVWRRYADLNESMRRAVIKTRLARGTPLNCFTLAEMNDYNAGYLLYFFMLAAAVRSLLFSVDPFDQPDVEAYKREMRRFIAEKGEGYGL